MMKTFARTTFVPAHFPQGIPRLWCPLLTHYRADGTIDREKMAQHWSFLAPFVKGFLIPGSTGDGWQLSEAETVDLIEAAIPLARTHGSHIIVGVLKAKPQEAVQLARVIQSKMQTLSGHQDLEKAYADCHFRGFTFCPPSGDDLTQDQIEEGLSQCLEPGWPAALYQLPQVTKNEISPVVFRRLAEKFPNLYLFKDTSGKDRIVQHAECPADIFRLRGMEGNYARWLKPHGPYDGFLLSSANSFGPELHRIIQDPESASSQQLSARLSRIMEKAFAAAAPVPQGNFFTNANKALYHWISHGTAGTTASAPILHGGQHLPQGVLDLVKSALDEP